MTGSSGNDVAEDKPAGKNWLEWLVFGMSCALVGGAMVFLAVEAATADEGPAVLEVKVGEETRVGAWVRVPVTVWNRGERVAANVQVAVAGDGEEAVAGTVTIDFVPRNSKRAGWVVFPASPRGSGVWLPQVIGYDEP